MAISIRTLAAAAALARRAASGWLPVLAALAALHPAVAAARELTAVGAIASSGPVTSEASRKIVSRLRGLAEDFRARGIGRHNAAAMGAARYSSRTLRVDAAGRVQVYVSVSDTAEATLAALRGRGLDVEIVNREFGIVQGWVAVEELEALAREPAVRKIRPPSYARPRTGPVNTQGDAIHRCDQARGLGFTGFGVKVGVISIGVAGLGASQGSGELGGVEVLSEGDFDAEGTAMLEIIRDCAPNAALAFAAAGGTTAAMIQSMNALLAAGSRIIVDDIGFLNEPIFEDGELAQANRTVGQAALRVTAGGNDGRAHWQGTFAPGNFDDQIPGTLHNFAGGDSRLRFQVSGNRTVTIVLQWANLHGAASDDYDLCVRDTGGALITCSVDVQNGNDDPIEAVDVSCPSNFPCLADIQITRFSASGIPRALSLFCFGACQFNEFNMRTGSIYGHTTVPEVVTVAAAAASAPATIDDYSSAGPTFIVFPALENRPKPDVTGIDCVATSRPGFNPFCGTSAAAPHVAGIAALVMEAMGPSATVAAVTSALKSTAIDFGPPGYDSDWGFGRADALAAVQSALQVSLAAAVLPGSRSVPLGTPATAFATILAIGNQTAVGCGIAPITGVPAVFHYQTTDPATNAVTGTPDTPVDIPAGGAQTFVIAFTPNGEFAPTDVQLGFSCSNAAAAPVVSGLNTLLLSASSTPVPDVIALAATTGNDGIVNIPGATGTGFFSVATANVGAGGEITVSADTGGKNLGVGILICRTDPASGVCISPLATTVTLQIDAGQSPTFAIFVTGSVVVAFDPANNRVIVRFKDSGGATRGATSAALRTQ